MPEQLADYREALHRTTLLPWRGRVLDANGQSLVSQGPRARIGEAIEVRTSSGLVHEGQMIGFREDRSQIMLIHAGSGGGAASGICHGDEVVALGHEPGLAVGEELLGRVLDARGVAIDGGAPLGCTGSGMLEPAPPGPFARLPIDQLLSTGVAALDGLLPVGRGQRIAIFGGSGVGKSTLLGMLARNCSADVVVIGLVGERGREVLEFLNESLGEQGRKKSVVVVATSDEAPLLKMRAALGATCIAEFFAAQGQQVLLILDSLSRFAMAAREIGLAAGEPPTNKGYTPSVFTKLARLVERAGRFRKGSITAFYTVLMEADDEQDPIVDAVRSFVDGHIMLSRDLALEGWYPPVDVLRSISRLATAVATPAHLADAATVRRQLAVYARSEDLIRIGAYQPGMDPELDQSIAARQQVRRFLNQSPHDLRRLEQSLQSLQGIATGGIATVPVATGPVA